MTFSCPSFPIENEDTGTSFLLISRDWGYVWEKWDVLCLNFKKETVWRARSVISISTACEMHVLINKEQTNFFKYNKNIQEHYAAERGVNQLLYPTCQHRICLEPSI